MSLFLCCISLSVINLCSQSILYLSFLWCLVIIMIRHQLGPNRPVSASSNSLFKGLPSRLRPFGLQFNIIFAILLLFIVVTCCRQFDLYLLSLSSAGSTFISSKISSFLFVVKKGEPSCSSEKINLE